MSDTKNPSEKQPGTFGNMSGKEAGSSKEHDKQKVKDDAGEKQPGTFHYNPGNMSGKEAGSSKEHDKQKVKDDAEHDGAPDESREGTKQGGKG